MAHFFGLCELIHQDIHNSICPKPSRCTAHLKPAFSCVENVTGNVSGFSNTLPFQKRDQTLKHWSYCCTQWNTKGASSKAQVWRSWMVAKGQGPQSSHFQLLLHTDETDWPDGFTKQHICMNIFQNTFWWDTCFIYETCRWFPSPTCKISKMHLLN